MLASSWKATDLVKNAWLRLEPPTRKELARLTGIAEPNLSGMNTGRMPMTLESAERIAAVVPGLTVADLGAREEEVAQSDPTVLDRLQRLEDDALTLEDLNPLLRVVQLLTAGKRAEAQRALSEAGLGP